MCFLPAELAKSKLLAHIVSSGIGKRYCVDLDRGRMCMCIEEGRSSQNDKYPSLSNHTYRYLTRQYFSKYVKRYVCKASYCNLICSRKRVSKCPSLGDWFCKLCHIHLRKYYEAIKKKRMRTLLMSS